MNKFEITMIIIVFALATLLGLTVKEYLRLSKELARAKESSYEQMGRADELLDIYHECIYTHFAYQSQPKEK